MIVFSIIDKDGDTDTLKTSRTKLTVGGAYTDDITLLDDDVSSEHGVFDITKEEVIYTDNGFGTLVSGREIVGESVPISPEDRVAVGSSVVTYTLEREETVPVRHMPSFTSDVIKVTRSSYSKAFTPAPGTSSPHEEDPSPESPLQAKDVSQTAPDFELRDIPKQPSDRSCFSSLFGSIKLVVFIIAVIFLLIEHFCG